MKEIIAYQCSYCNKVSLTKTGIINHEKRCRNNYDVVQCKSCSRFFFDEEQREFVCRKSNEILTENKKISSCEYFEYISKKDRVELLVIQKYGF